MSDQKPLQDEKLRAALAGPITPKFLATRGPDGIPNIVPVISIEPWDDDSVIFGDLMLWKTKMNLANDTRVGFGLITESLLSWTLIGDFLGFERTGEKLETLNSRELYRYNAYTGLRAAGTIRIQKAKQVRGLLTPKRMAEIMFASLKAKGSGDGVVPNQVLEKFARQKAAKFISYISPDGYPLALPAPSLFPTGGSTFEVGAGNLRGLDGAMPTLPLDIAAAIITFDPIAYQVKGRINRFINRLGTSIAEIEITEVYSASPPLPGKSIIRTPAKV